MAMTVSWTLESTRHNIPANLPCRYCDSIFEVMNVLRAVLTHKQSLWRHQEVSVEARLWVIQTERESAREKKWERDIERECRSVSASDRHILHDRCGPAVTQAMQGKAEQHSTTHMIDTYSQPTPAVPEGGTTSSTASTTAVSQQEQSAIKCICTGRLVNKMPPYNKTVFSNLGHSA